MPDSLTPACLRPRPGPAQCDLGNGAQVVPAPGDGREPCYQERERRQACMGTLRTGTATRGIYQGRERYPASWGLAGWLRPSAPGPPTATSPYAIEVPNHVTCGIVVP